MTKKNKIILLVSGAVLLVAAIIGIVVFMPKNDNKLDNKEPNKVVTNTYKINFNSNGGTEVTEQTIKDGSNASKPVDPTREGYVFVEWLLDDKSYDFSKPVNKEITLVAKWLENKDGDLIVVQYDTDGGTTIKNSIVKKGDKVELPQKPTKKGYVFVEWQIDGEKYDNSSTITSDTKITAIWEKVEEDKQESKIAAPKIELIEAGNVDPKTGEINTFFYLKELKGTLEIYYSESENGTYELARSTTKPDDEKSKWYNISIPKGKHYYFKTRYLVDGNYSDYSNIIHKDNSFKTPEIELVEAGSVNPTTGDISTFLRLKEVDGTIDIYYATSKSGKYSKLRTAYKPDDEKSQYYNISIPKGSHYYFKVRYTSNGLYSKYSNVIHKDNSFKTPKIELIPMGSIDPLKGHSTYLGIDEVQGKLEIHYATSKDGNYQLLRTATKPETGKNYSINIPSGHQHYYKVRFVNNGVYSNFSNVIFIDNSFKTPTIEEIPMGSVHPINGKSTYFKLNNFQGKFEIHYATSRDGNYQLLRTVTKEETNNQYNITIPSGHHYFIKVRFANEGVYSGFSNIVEYDNSFQTPTIEEIPMGSVHPINGKSTYFKLNNFQGKFEIHYATSRDGNYQLLRTVTKEETNNQYNITIPAGHHYYVKVRFANEGAYSNYSNIIEFNNSFQTPVIEEVPMGNEDPNTGELSTYFAVDNYQGKLEIYYSESQNGTYTLARVAEKPEDENSNHYAIKVPAGKVYYFKVRFANNGVYSTYSNVLTIDNK